MSRRGRLLAVLTTLAVGAVGVISSTQTWLVVVLDDGSRHELAVTGAAAIPVLAPLSLAALALGAALSIAGLVLRYAFGGLTVLLAVSLGALSGRIAFTTPTGAVASTVTAATGVAGSEAIDALTASVRSTPWPGIMFALSALLLAAGGFIIATARTWSGSGRRFEADSAAAGAAAGKPAPRVVDAMDSWDDLSRGADPTADPTADPPAGAR